MKKLMALTMAWTMVFCSGCGGDTHETIAAESLGVMKDLAAKQLGL